MRNRFLKVLLLVVLLASVLMPTFISQPQTVQATSGLQQPILGGHSDALNYATTTAEYNMLMGGITWSATENTRWEVIPTNGSIGNLYVRLSADPTNANSSYTFTIMKNGVATSLTCTIAAGSTTGSDVDPAHAVSLVAGDMVSIRSVATATDPASASASWSTLWTSTATGESIVMSMWLASTTATQYYSLGGYIYATTDAVAQVPMPTNGNFSKMYVNMSIDAGTAPDAYTVIFRNGGVNGSNTVTVIADNKTGSITNVTDAVVAGNLVDFGVYPVDTPSAAPYIAIGIVFISNTDGESCIFGGSSDAVTNSQTEYNFLAHNGADLWITTEATMYSTMQACTIRNLYVQLSAAAGAGNDYTISVNKNAGAASGLTVNIAGAVATSGNDVANSYVAAFGDTAGLVSVPNSSPTSVRVKASVVAYIAPAATNVYLTTSSSSGGDCTTPAEGTWAYNVSEVVNISATADACYHFVNWTGNTTDIGDVNAISTNISMGSSNKSATANFAINVSTVTYAAGAGGSVNGSWPENVDCGNDGSWVLASPNACYHFVDWDDASTANPRQETNVTSNVSLTANFAKDVFTVEFVAGANGAVNGSWPENVDCGDDSSWVEATADPCYHFVDWDDSSTDNPRQELNVTANVSYTANFDIDVQTVEYIAGANGAVNGSWPENVNCGSNGSWVEATPDVCYEFVNWSDSSTDNPRQDTNVTSNISVTANFAIIEYELTINSTDGGDVKIPTEGTHTYNCASPVSIEAEADTCYHFVNWSGDTATLDGINNSLTVIDMYGNYSITANFAIDLQSVEYIAGAHGSVNGSWPEIINCGNNSSWVLATPDLCYHFVNWSDASTDNPRQDTSVSSNISVIANFAFNVYTVTYVAGAGGAVNSSWPQNVNCGDNSSWVMATANACYKFVNWSDASTANPRHEVNVSANLSYTANFAVNTSVITYIAGANGTINGTAVQTVNCGASSTSVTAIPNSCYHFTTWSDANTSATRTDIGTSTNQTFTASFTIDTVTLNVSSGANGDVTTPIEGTHAYNCGQVVNLTATPDWGYNFSSWSGDTGTILDVNDETTTITMNGNYSINCSFVGSLSLFPPTNLVPTLTENTSGNTSFWCLNLSWTKGVNSPETIIVICRDSVLPCANKSTTNLSTDCMVIYNGNGSSFVNSCGWQIDYYDYTITAWGSDGAGNYSALCTNLSLGGTKMTSLFGIAIGISIAIIMLGLALWKKQWWIFITDGIIWFILMAFAFTQYTTADMMYWFGFVYLVLAIICIGCVFWFREKHETIEEEPEETQDEVREKRSKKLSALRNLGHKVSGKDY